MIDANLITRRSGRYFLTSFGKVVYEAQMLRVGDNKVIGNLKQLIPLNLLPIIH
jgi:hypothetical protein